MRRVVGAAIVILVLGGSKIAQWVAARHPTISADSTLHARVPHRPHDALLPQVPTVISPGRASLLPLSFRRDPLHFLSTAPADSLELLPGVGPVLATRLLDTRRDVGAFQSWDDVDRVRGIGPKTIERLKASAIAR
jgi:hypothetical protein